MVGDPFKVSNLTVILGRNFAEDQQCDDPDWYPVLTVDMDTVGSLLGMKLATTAFCLLIELEK